MGVGVVGRRETHLDSAVRIADAVVEEGKLILVAAPGLRSFNGA